MNQARTHYADDKTLEYIASLEQERASLRGLLAEAEEEMRLIRMKDSRAIYDPTLRMRIRAALQPKEDK